MNKLKILLASFILMSILSVFLGTLGFLSYGVFLLMMDHVWVIPINVGFVLYGIYIFLKE